MWRRNKRVVCFDGFTMSVQADEGAYCSPRVTGAERYAEVEIGFPSHREPLLDRYVEDASVHHSYNIFSYVPASVVSLILAKHGGMVEGELPSGIPELKPTRNS